MSVLKAPRIPVNGAPTVLPRNLPQVFGVGDDRRRLYSVADLSFNAFDQSGRERPPIVPLPWFTVSLVMDADAVTLRILRDGERFVMDGYDYRSLAAAERTMYRAAVVGFLVYELDAAGLGLPVTLQWTTHKTPAGGVCRWSFVAAPLRLADAPAADRVCPSDCPGSTVEPVTNLSEWAACEHCRTIQSAYKIDEHGGLCDICGTL